MQTEKNILIYLFIFICLFFSSCSTTLKVNVTRPANIDLLGAKTIAVIPFEKSQDNPINYFFDIDRDSFEDYFNHFTQIASAERSIINYIKGQFERELSRSNYISLIYGNPYKADIFITGEIISLRVHDIEKSIKKEVPEDEILDNNEKLEKTEYYYDFIYSREVQLIFNYEIVDGRSRKVIAYDTIKIENQSDFFKNTTLLPNIYEMVKYDLDNFIWSLVRNIQPFNTTKSISLLKDKNENPDMEHADSLAKNGYYHESYREFVNIYVNTGLMEAGYNAAMILMALGKLENAEKLMTDVYDNCRSPKVYDGLLDIKNEIRQAKILENQLNY